MSNLISIEKQYELMYTDAVQVSYEVKRAIFDLTKWIVSLHGLIVGFAAIATFKLDWYFILAPLLIGLVGLVLLQGFQSELNSHRKTLAQLRHSIGGDVATIHHEHVNRYYHNKNKSVLSYWNLIRSGHFLVLLASTAIATFSTYMCISDLSP